jgi:hypothetical protein
MVDFFLHGRFAALSLKAFPLLINRVKIIPIPEINTTLLTLAIVSEVLLMYIKLYRTLLMRYPPVRVFSVSAGSPARFPARTSLAKNPKFSNPLV